MQCERYGGEDLLSGQETLNTLTQLQEAWVEVCLQLFRRHPAPGGEPPKGQVAMRELDGAVTELHKQLSTRISGESGEKLATCLQLVQSASCKTSEQFIEISFHFYI